MTQGVYTLLLKHGLHHKLSTEEVSNILAAAMSDSASDADFELAKQNIHPSSPSSGGVVSASTDLGVCTYISCTPFMYEPDLGCCCCHMTSGGIAIVIICVIFGVVMMYYLVKWCCSKSDADAAPPAPTTRRAPSPAGTRACRLRAAQAPRPGRRLPAALQRPLLRQRASAGSAQRTAQNPPPRRRGAPTAASWRARAAPPTADTNARCCER